MEDLMESPILKWIFGSALVLGCPLGVLCALSSGSFLEGIVGMVTVVLVVLLACRRDIIREYNDGKISSKMAKNI